MPVATMITLRPIGTIRSPLALVALAALAHGAVPASCAPAPRGTGFDHARVELVRSLEASGIRDSATLAALRAVPRHEFVPSRYRDLAYADQALPIAEGQTISQPYIVAVMTEAIRPRPGLRVLEVGTGSGYQAAVLAQAGCRVYTIEILKPLADSARVLLKRLGYAGIQVRHGDGYKGWPEAAPFDAIVVTAAPERMPPVLVAQLAPGGRLVAPLGPEGGVQELVLLTKDERGAVATTRLLPVRFVPMVSDSLR